AATTYTYDMGPPAKVTVTTTSSLPAQSVEAEYIFDDLGRVTQETQRIPGTGTPRSVRETLYDGLNRKVSVSEPGLNAPADAKTLFLGYDPFGRVNTVRAPDS